MDNYMYYNLQSSKVYVDNSEFGYTPSGVVQYKRTIINSPTGTCAVWQDSAYVQTLYAVHTDYLGSWVAITNSAATVTNRYSYDAWGRARNVNNWELKPVSITNALTNLNAFQPRFDRGYTGHEHLSGFGLIHMNARVYDPYLQRFLSPDNYIQDMTNAQNYNRYSYCINNPLKYVDPSGNKWKKKNNWTMWAVNDVLSGGAISSIAVTTGLTSYVGMFPATNQAYEVQKLVSPVAIKPNFNVASIQNGVGFDVSVGMPSGTGGYRFNYGSTYYGSNYGDHQGFETRKGGEWQITPGIKYSGTKFNSGETSQTTGMWTLGNPFFNIKYENDMMFGWKMPGVPEADGGDRFRTAAVRIDAGAASLNLNMFTGDPGLTNEERKTYYKHGSKIYKSGSSNEEKYRAGVLSGSIGLVQIGRNSENVRNTFQNELVHKNMNPPSPLFKKLDIEPSWFLYFGTGSGSTLW